jgi:hypothetical protein
VPENALTFAKINGVFGTLSKEAFLRTLSGDHHRHHEIRRPHHREIH